MTRRHAGVRSRILKLGAVLAAVAVLLAGCAIPLPEVEADAAADGPRPALDEPRLDRVLAAVAETIEAGDADLDAELLEPRISGPALETRQAEYRLASATADAENPIVPQQLTTEPQVVAVGNSDTWPKTVFVFTTIADGMNTPLLIGLQQADPRADYTMFAWVRLLPETTTPATAVAAEGSPEVAPDAEGLVLTPAQTLDAYADVLQNGDDSDNADTFAEDAARNILAEIRTEIEDSVSDAGTFSEEYSVADGDPISLETADGGAIVIGALRSEEKYELTEDGGELTISTPEVVALTDNESSIDVEDTVTATYYLTVAFYVPPASDGATIQVLGAERVVDGVEGE